MQCMKISSIGNALRQISYGFSKRVTTYGCYDMNGYRFRSEKYEYAKSGLTIVNSGVCVSCVDEDDNMLNLHQPQIFRTPNSGRGWIKPMTIK